MKIIDITSPAWIEIFKNHIQTGVDLHSVCAGWKYSDDKFPVFVDQYGIEPVLISLTDVKFPVDPGIKSIEDLGDFLLAEIDRIPSIKCGEFPAVRLIANLGVSINIGFLNFGECERFSRIRLDFEFQPVNP